MKPFENIKVLDLTRVLAGPFSTMILQEMGAEIIKIEVPEVGDDARQFGPFKNGKSAYFTSINRGKKSISLNLKSEKGKEILKELIMKADLIVENFRPGTMEKLGLGYETIKKLNPRIVYAACSGFGHTGPESEKASYDILAQAAGIMSITGWPGNPPTRVGMSIADIGSGLYLTIGIMSALYQQKVTGLGLKVDVSILDSQIGILENAIVRTQVENKAPEPIGNRHPTITPFQAYKANDKWFVIAVGNDSLWKLFCKVIGKDDMGTNPKFSTNKTRTENIIELNQILDSVFITKNSDEWLKLIDDAKIPCGPINSIDKLLVNEQANFRNMFVEVDDEKIGKIKVVGNPVKLSTLEEVNFRNPAPEIGENNYDILKQLLGYDSDYVDNLKKEGVL